jgi:hypothetical protein
MSRSNAQAWWVDVEDVRERIESRRASEKLRAQRREFSGRRTVSITGHPARAATRMHLVADASEARPVSASSRRRPPRSVAERIGGRPDRIAGWAVLLGFALVLVTILTAHG